MMEDIAPSSRWGNGKEGGGGGGINMKKGHHLSCGTVTSVQAQ